MPDPGHDGTEQALKSEDSQCSDIRQLEINDACRRYSRRFSDN